MADGGDLEDAVPARLQIGPDEIGELVRLGDVDLVEGDQLRPLDQRDLAVADGVGGQLAQNDVEVGQRIAAGFESGAVEDVDQGGAPLDVAEEFEAEASPSLAPSMRPGTSATVKRDSPACTTPRLGARVVKG